MAFSPSPPSDVPIHTQTFNSSIFARMVSNPLVEIASLDDYTGAASDKITRIHGEHLNTYILPADLMWPVGLDSKQRRYTHRHVCFERLGVCNTNRDNEILRLLWNSEDACVIGSPGIGKSSSTNLILMRLLQLMNTTRIKRVLHRVATQIFVYTWNSNSNSIETFVERDADGLKEVRKISRKYYEMGVPCVLVLELREAEMDPADIPIPCLVTASSREADVTLKTFLKAGHPFFIQDAWNRTEVEEASLVLEKLKLKPSREEVMRRFDLIGGLPRYLFGPSDLYDPYENNFKEIEGNVVMRELNHLTIYNVPRNLKFFIGPYIKPKVDIPVLGKERIYFWKFHSEAAAARILGFVQLPAELQYLEQFGFSYQMLEAAMTHSGILRECNNTSYNLSSWKWYKDVGSKQQLAYEDEVLPLEYPKIERTERFDGRYLNRSVWTLEQGVLYRSLCHDFAVGEHVFVDHVAKKVYYFQSTLSQFSHHLFKISTVKNVIEGLRMLSPMAEGYKMVIVGVNDMSLHHPTGIGFTDNETTVSLSNWQKQVGDKEYSSRVETILARAKFFSVADTFALAHREKPLSEDKHILSINMLSENEYMDTGISESPSKSYVGSLALWK